MKRIALVGMVLSSLWIGCSREPAIVIRFDPVDMRGRRDPAPVVDAALAMRPDAAAAAGALAIDGAKVEAPGRGAVKVERPKARAQCGSDAECVIVPDGCCGCANGGKQRAVKRSEEADLRSAQRATCKEVMCTMMVSTDPTCGKRVACVEGMCVMRDARPEEQRKLGPN